MFRPTHRKLAALLAVLAMLFSQLALATYVCPMEQAVSAETVMDAECCQDGASASVHLCHEHCKDARSVVPDTAPDLPRFLPAFTVMLADAPARVPLGEYSQSVVALSTAPPLAILHCCFRI